MSVLSHLTDTASKAVLSTEENTSIQTSIGSLQTKIKAWFGDDVSEHFKFGSFTRDTILPRKVDEHSDVDYMIVFKDGTAKPQTYLDRLRKFVETKYGRSEIYQSSPTIVLDLSHIKFELVPAISQYGSYSIPGPATGWMDWITTSPNAFNTTLTDANKRNGYNLKPLIRLVKYWNARAGYVYDSFGLEQYLVGTAYQQSSLKDYLYWAFGALSLSFSDAQWRRDKLTRAKEIIANTRTYEQQQNLLAAETEIKKLIPVIS